MKKSEYFAKPGINNSSLGTFKKSPLHYKWDKDNPDEEPKDYFQLGDIYHRLILEPDTIGNDIVFYDLVEDRPQKEMTMGSKENKAWLADLTEKTIESGKELISLDLKLTAEDMVASTQKSSQAWDLIKAKGNKYEQYIEWTVEGILCKCKMDVRNEHFNADLKTTRPTDPWGWQRFAWSHDYYRQAGMYSDGEADGQYVGEKDFYFIVCENAPPYDVFVVCPSYELLQHGIVEYRQLIKEMSYCLEKDKWPGQADKNLGIPFIWELPSWEKS